MTFANCLDPYQARRHVGPDMSPKPFGTLMLLTKEFYEKVNFEKNQQATKSHEHVYPVCKEIILRSRCPWFMDFSKREKVNFIA